MNFMRLHPGLRLSVVGGAVFIIGLLLLLALPPAVSVAVMIAGGMGVWSGFLWTLFAWYSPPPTSDDGA